MQDRPVPKNIHAMKPDPPIVVVEDDPWTRLIGVVLDRVLVQLTKIPSVRWGYER